MTLYNRALIFMKVYHTIWAFFLLINLSASAQSKGYSLKFDESDIDRHLTSPIHSYASILKSVTPSVVAVTTRQVVRKLYPGTNNPIEDLLRRYYGLPRLNQPRIEEEVVPAGIDRV